VILPFKGYHLFFRQCHATYNFIKERKISKQYKKVLNEMKGLKEEK